MKKLLALLLILALTAGCGTALAASQTAWNQACTKKIPSGATAYAWDEESESLVSAGSVPAGSYVKQGADDDVCRARGVARVTWCTSDGSTHSGYVYPSAIASATASVKLENGATANVPEALMSDTTELYKYLWKNYEAAMRGQSSKGDASSGSVKAADPAFSVEYLSDDGEPLQVTVRELGLVWTDILVGTTPLSVHTEKLYWTCEVENNISLAVVYAPKSGKASMYAKKDTKSTVVKKCLAGKIVFVINKGSSYARVWYDGHIGYMLTSTLTFCAPVAAAKDQAAVLAYKGKTNGRAKVKVRLTPSTKARVICSPVTGTEVIVTATDGTWAEVDVNGYHGYVQTKFLQDLE